VLGLVVFFFRGFSYSDGGLRVLGIICLGARVPTLSFRLCVETTAHFTILAEEPLTNRNRHILVDRAGVRLLFTHPKFREEIENDAGFNFQFPGQLVNPNFLHRRDC
jgi:hypothetical protein